MEFKTPNGMTVGPEQYRMNLELSGTDEQLEIFRRFMLICDIFGYDFEEPVSEEDLDSIGNGMYGNLVDI